MEETEIKCIECGGLLVKTEENELVCSSCGLVQHEKSYLGEEYEESTFQIPKLPIGSKIISNGYGVFKDPIKRPLEDRMHEFIRNISRLDYKLKAYQASAQIGSKLLNNFLQISSELNLSRNLAYSALRLYLKAFKYLKTKGYEFSCPTISAACLLVTTRLYGGNKIVNLDEITESFLKHGHRVTKSKIAWCASIISRRLVEKQLSYKQITKLYLDRFLKLAQCDDGLKERIKEKNPGLDLQTFIEKIRKEASDIIENIESRHVQSKNPVVLASAILYMADKVLAKKQNLKPVLSQKMTSKVCKVPEYSLREHIPLIAKLLK